MLKRSYNSALKVEETDLVSDLLRLTGTTLFLARGVLKNNLFKAYAGSKEDHSADH